MPPTSYDRRVTEAVLLIAFVAFAARIVFAARTMNRLAAAALVLLGIAIYAIPFVGGYRLELSVLAAYVRMGGGFFILLDALMLALGFGVPVLLRYSEQPRSRGRHATFLLCVLLTVFLIDLWLVARHIPPAFELAAPEIWFAAGVGAFLVVRLRFFEDD